MVCPECGSASISGRCESCGIVLTAGGDASPVAEDPEVTRTADRAFRLPPDFTSGAWPDTAENARPRLDELASGLVGRPLGPRYRILELVGVGGMGAVYRAWDEQLGVDVALKTIRPDMAAAAETAWTLDRRFKQELLLARKITHKNIVRVYDMGEVDGVKYITMPFIRGEDLATILKREGRLPVVRVMKIARSIVSGLSAAHEVGVVHRDLKPANIMIDVNGDALIMDFGVARSSGTPQALLDQRLIGSASGRLSDIQTVAGAVVGSTEYMPPEQARGGEVDQRADIYAFGLILYDLLLGRTRAHRTNDVRGELKLRMTQPLPPPRSEDPTIPVALDSMIARCIQPKAADRFATTLDLGAALGRLDDTGRPLPIARRVTARMVAATIAVFASFVGVTYWQARGPALPLEHEPVTVVIADFQNATGDPELDLALEPIAKFALEGAPFISAYDRLGIVRTIGIPMQDGFDEKAAIQFAIKERLAVVFSSVLTKDDNGIRVSVKATEAVTGKVISSEDGTAIGKDEVLGVVSRLANNLRVTLGDDSPDTAHIRAMETLSATAPEVVRNYGKAMVAMSLGRFDDAVQSFSRVIERDPSFGLAFAGMALVSSNLGRKQDAEKYVNEAVRLADGMTERERYRTRGLSALFANDYRACLSEFGDLIRRYPGDASARNNRALCVSKLRDLKTAAEDMKELVRILPNRGLYRVNLAAYAAYSGDSQTAEYVSLNARGLSPWAPQVLAFAQTLQGRVEEAAQSYRELGKSTVGPSFAASGLADLAVYQGRYAEAVQLLRQAAEADLAANEPDRAAFKLVAVGFTELLRQNKAAAIAAAEEALAKSGSISVRFIAARVLIEAGLAAAAESIAAGLANDSELEAQAHGGILAGLIALARGDEQSAIERLVEANGRLDTWIGHFDLGRAYLAASAYRQTESEFDLCISRRGEALALFLDEEPTFGLFPPVYYYQGLAREGLKSERSAESYRAYLDIRGQSTEDALVEEIRRRAPAR